MATAIVSSGWDARALDPNKEAYELWYGSTVLLHAVDADKIGLDDALDRIALNFLGFAAARLGTDAARAIGSRVDQALGRALGFANIPDLPDVEMPSATGTELLPPLMSITDGERPKSQYTQSFFERMNETPEAYSERQKRSRQTFGRFGRELTAADARLVIEDMSFAGIKSIVEADPTLAAHWLDVLLGLATTRLRPLHLFGLQLASAIIDDNPGGAAALFARLTEINPIIRHVVGFAKIPVEAITLWSKAYVSEIQALCFDRLDRAATDKAMAAEVLAAFEAGAQTAVSAYVALKLTSNEPAQICRALMVVGFSDESSEASATLDRYAGTPGFIGQAQAAAKYTYQRNSWARHWYQLMTTTDDPVEFWRYSILFLKVVDGRYALWGVIEPRFESPIDRFLPTLENRIQNRIEKRQNKRRDKLFGEQAPDDIFLS